MVGPVFLTLIILGFIMILFIRLCGMLLWYTIMSLYVFCVSLFLTIKYVDNIFLKVNGLILLSIILLLTSIDIIASITQNLAFIKNLLLKFGHDWAYASSIGIIHSLSSLYSYLLGINFYMNNDVFLEQLEPYLTTMHLGILTMTAIVTTIISLMIYLPRLQEYYSFSIRVTLIMAAALLSISAFSLGMFSGMASERILVYTFIIGSIIALGLGGIFGVPLLAFSSVKIVDDKRVPLFSIPAMLAGVILFVSLFIYSTLSIKSELYNEIKAILDLIS